tara:strand:+ start:635 stop:922 length:288 start_codon:yes stop_codon:yes gene_type:complete
MSNHIDKNNPKRWFIVQDNESGEEGIKVFGYAGDQGVNELETGQPNLTIFLTEDELEIAVNNIAAIPDYYKDAVESLSDKFQAPSEKYPIIMELP